MSRPQGLLGVFGHSDAFVTALKTLRSRGFEIGEAFSPIPDEEVLELVHPRPSPVRYYTFVGGATGLVTGLALALLSTSVWGLVVSGKPVYSIVPFFVVAFELTILFGALGNLLGLFVTSGLPFRRFPAGGYRPAFSRDRYGVWVTGPVARLADARGILSEAGAVEVEDLGDVGTAP